MFDELGPDASLIRIEEQVRRYWQRQGVAQSARPAEEARTAAGPVYTIVQQPLAAAGQPPAEQAALLATGDLLARYRRMAGDRVYHRIDWAGHGLGVETAVERALGEALAQEEYDLARFNAACRAAAVEGVQRGEALATRLAVWAEPGYLTLDVRAVEKVWAALKRLWDGGRLRHEQAVVPFCPHCATPLSSAEAGRRAVEVDRQALWVLLPWIDEPNGYLLLWAPSPWMLLGLVAVAAHPETEYAVVEVSRGGDGAPTRLLLAEAARERALRVEHRLVRRLPGKALRGMHYRPLFTFLPEQAGVGSVLVTAALPADRGSGLTPVVPAFDAASLAVAGSHHLPIPELTDEIGRLGVAVTPWRGLSPLDAEPLVAQNLMDRGLVFREQSPEKYSQAMCPYCATPLVPLARAVWLAGRWLVSRDRPWGAPLPIWQCARCGRFDCIAGLSELAARTGLDAGQIEVHRPQVDRLAFACTDCGGEMRRVTPVLDAGFEAAVLPGAWAPEPGLADVAVGIGDREMGWLGDLGEVAAGLRGTLAWGQAVALPEQPPAGAHDVDLAAADAVRWSAYTGTTVDQASEFLEHVWRLAVADSPPPGGPVESATRVRLLHGIARITAALDACDPRLAADELAQLMDDQALAVEPGLSRLMAPFLPHLAEALYQRSRSGLSVHLENWPSPP